MFNQQRMSLKVTPKHFDETIRLVTSKVKKLLANLAVSSKERYTVATCINRLKRIATYAELMNVLEKNQHKKAMIKLQIYIRYEEEKIRQILKPYDINFDEILIVRNHEDNDSPEIISKQIFNNTNQSEVLILCTDLFRDFDDWLVLISTILVGKYREIMLITSNEVNGECAKVAASFIPALTQMSKDMHGFAPTITVYRGLEAFDFADNKHEPPKEYAANMRLLPAIGEPPSSIYSLANLYSQLKLCLQNKQAFDLISIGKIADHDIVWVLLETIGCVPNKDIILGAKPTNGKGTNTNVPIHHLFHIRDHCMMLDSRYGTHSLIRKAMFQVAINEMNDERIENPMGLVNPDNFNQGEQYLYRLLLALFKRGKESKSSKQIANATLQHLANLQYPTGGFYDVYALACALASKLDFTEHEILFAPDKDNDMEHPLCAMAAKDARNHQGKKLTVKYPNPQQLEQFIHETLINKIFFNIKNSEENTRFKNSM